MLRFFALVGVAASGLLMAADVVKDDEPKETVQITKTEHADLPPAGAVRLTHSSGALTIQGWDRAEVEITTTKTTKKQFASPARAQAAKELEQVRVTPERHGDELVIATSMPKHRLLARPFRGASDYTVEYLIKVPVNARLFIDHDHGDVNIEGVRGDLHATNHDGQITVRLPQEGSYAIDAQSKLGHVESDFAGHQRGHIGHAFLHQTSASSQKLFLRVRFGDILILKINQPQAPEPATPK